MYPNAPGTTPQPTSPYATPGAPANPAQGQINPNQINQVSQPGLPNLAQMGQGFAGGGSVGQAKGLASFGRGQDSMLVHMTPGEVQGLQKLAMSAGGSLTINPHTGLPEAGFLSSLLPTLAGAATMYFTGSPWGAALAGGLTGAATNKQNPLMGAIMGGMSGYTMGGLGDALKGVGEDAAKSLAQGELTAAQTAADTTANAARQAAIEKATEEQGQALANFNADQAAGVSSAVNAAPPTFPYNPQQMGQGAYEGAYEAYDKANQFTYKPETQAALSATPQQNMQAGFGKVTGSWDAAKDFASKNPKTLFGAAAPIGLAALQAFQPKNTLGGIAPQPTRYYNTTYNPGKVNPLRGQIGQPYSLGQSYGLKSYGPIANMAQGGTASAAATDMFQTPEQDRPFKSASASTLASYAKGAKDSKLQAAAIQEQYLRANADSPYVQAAAQGGLMGLAVGGPTDASSPIFDAAGKYYKYNPATQSYEYATKADQPLLVNPMAMTNDYNAQFGAPENTVNTGPFEDQANPFVSAPVEDQSTFSPASLAQMQAAEDAQTAIGMADTSSPTGGIGSIGMGTDSVGSVGGSGEDAPDGGAPDSAGGNGDVGEAHGGRIYSKYAAGGMASMPEYAAGGKLLRGPGDGMSDSIPAVIKGPRPQRAALADGEFVIPADVVSHLGNGSTEAGSKRLYSMMDKIRHARTGNKKQGKQINPAQFMPA
jgi:hypothetical protein